MQNDSVDTKALLAQVVERQDRAEADITDLKAGQRQTNSRLGNLTDSIYEQRIVRRFRSIARRHLDIGSAQVLQAANQPYAPALKAVTDNAEKQNLIDYDEMEALDEADIIDYGRRRNGSPVFVVVEVSETADNNDIARVRERATQQATIAVVIGKDISDTNFQSAAQQEVAVIILGGK